MGPGAYLEGYLHMADGKRTGGCDPLAESSLIGPMVLLLRNCQCAVVQGCFLIGTGAGLSLATHNDHWPWRAAQGLHQGH